MEHQTFWKPEKKVKEKKSYNSLQQRKPKPKKEIPEWKKDILSHHNSKPSRSDRAEFPRKVIEQLIERAGGLCECCKQRPDTESHHVMPRCRNGRGVYTNGMRLCGLCHHIIQTNEEQLQYWINEWTKKFGENFWFDEMDWEEHNRKQAAIQETEEEQKQRLEELEPIINLLSTAAGRKLRAKEIRLLNNMDKSEMTVFAKMMADVLGASTQSKPDIPFGYGHFDD